MNVFVAGASGAIGLPLVRELVRQGHFLRLGEGLADESEGLATAASPEVAAEARIYTELEARVLADGMAGVAGRLGAECGWISRSLGHPRSVPHQRPCLARRLAVDIR